MLYDLRFAVRMLLKRPGFTALAALLASRVLQSFLFEVEPIDPVTLAAAGALFVAVSVVACWVPTRRAIAVDPLEALRCE